MEWNADAVRLIWEVVISILALAGLVRTELNRRQAATHKELRDMDGRIDAQDVRLVRVEAEVNHLPNTDEIRKLEGLIASMDGNIKQLVSRVDGWGEATRKLEGGQARIETFMMEHGN